MGDSPGLSNKSDTKLQTTAGTRKFKKRKFNEITMDSEDSELTSKQNADKTNNKRLRIKRVDGQVKYLNPQKKDKQPLLAKKSSSTSRNCSKRSKTIEKENEIEENKNDVTDQ